MLRTAEGEKYGTETGPWVVDSVGGVGLELLERKGG